MAVLLACKKQRVKSLGESNVICHEVGPDEMMRIKKTTTTEAVGFLQ